MRTSGFTTAQMDILLTVPEMKSSVQNYMDLLTDAGFLLLGPWSPCIYLICFRVCFGKCVPHDSECLAFTM